MAGSATEQSWSAMNPSRDIPVEMQFCSAVFDLTDEDHRKKYNSLMTLTRNVVAGEFKQTKVQIKEYDSKWVSDGRYFVMVQWFQVGDPSKFVPDEGVRPVQVRSHSTLDS